MVSIHGPLGYGPSTLPLRHSAVRFVQLHVWRNARFSRITRWWTIRRPRTVFSTPLKAQVLVSCLSYVTICNLGGKVVNCFSVTPSPSRLFFGSNWFPLSYSYWGSRKSGRRLSVFARVTRWKFFFFGPIRGFHFHVSIFVNIRNNERVFRALFFSSETTSTTLFMFLHFVSFFYQQTKTTSRWTAENASTADPFRRRCGVATAPAITCATLADCTTRWTTELSVLSSSKRVVW